MKRFVLFLCIFCVFSCTWSMFAGERITMNLSDNRWYLWLDKEAEWKNDRLYLPSEIGDLSLLPVNIPSGGWSKLSVENAVNVSAPGTVEEYLTVSDYPRPEHFIGVSWWFRTLEVPEELKTKRFILSFESVRMRAEVYLDGQLVAYDLIGESPFEADITACVKPGKKQQLAVRVTNPGGNFHWQDFDIQKWGKYNIPPGRGFGGIIGRVYLDVVNTAYISDIYMQNTPQVTTVNAIVSFRNEAASASRQEYELIIREKTNPEKIVFRKKTEKIMLPSGDHTLTIPISVPEARLWDLDTPHLYTCEVILKKGKKTVDRDNRTFGFRWFAADGIGKDAVLRLNGRRVMLKSAISWGYWPVTGLIATPEMAEKQIDTARELGLNMLNFHRCIGSPVVLEKADEMGVLYYEEPGSFHSANHDPFIRTIVNEKLKRMIRRDRSHPSLVIYNLINEFGGVLSRDKELVAKRMNDMREAHAVDPSRIMTFTSGWAGQEHTEEDSKAHMLPFDTTLYRKGWFDNHRAGGPETWLETYYNGPKDNFMYTNNKTEVYIRGEEGALSAPPRIQLIYDEIKRSGKTGWDGHFWEKQYQAFTHMFETKNLKPAFGSIDTLTRKMGNVSFEHQGRRIQGMRMQNLGDGYMVNGWEAMPYDNHSGIVDIYRNPKGDASVLAYYTQPLFIAVSSRSQVVKLPGQVGVDFYIVNEKNLKGKHTLQMNVLAPNGKVIYTEEKSVVVQGGEVFGQLLLENIVLPISHSAGKYTIRASLKDQDDRVCAEGYDEVVAVDWQADDMKGKGAYYGKPSDKVVAFYEKETNKELPAFHPGLGPLDWIVITRPSLDEPVLVDPVSFVNEEGKSTLQVTFYKDNDMKDPARKGTDEKIDRSFIEGAQPDASVPANQPFSVVWEGKLFPPKTGQYLVGVTANCGVRLYVNGIRMIDEWSNEKTITLSYPVMMETGKSISVRVEYRQNKGSGEIQLKWSQPASSAIHPTQLLDRVKNDGTTLILLDAAESWMETVAANANLQYNGYYSVGRNWVGGIHFVKEHPLFEGLPVNDAMNWPYQAVVRNGDRRFGFRMNGEELVVGSYRSTPFELGTAVGVIPYGKGKIIFSTLDISDNLDQPAGAADVARKIVCNYIKYAMLSNL